MLSLLLDENIKPEVARQINAQQPDIAIISVHSWEQKRLRGASDREVVQSAAEANLTLVTYDVNTIPTLLVRLANESFVHGGVVFVNNATIRSNDIGGLVKALIHFYFEERDAEWKNRIYYLRPVR